MWPTINPKAAQYSICGLPEAFGRCMRCLPLQGSALVLSMRSVYAPLRESHACIVCDL